MIVYPIVWTAKNRIEKLVFIGVSVLNLTIKVQFDKWQNIKAF